MTQQAYCSVLFTVITCPGISCRGVTVFPDRIVFAWKISNSDRKHLHLHKNPWHHQTGQMAQNTQSLKPPTYILQGMQRGTQERRRIVPSISAHKIKKYPSLTKQGETKENNRNEESILPPTNQQASFDSLTQTTSKQQFSDAPIPLVFIFTSKSTTRKNNNRPCSTP